jgi:6-phosphogluconolactonase (cycloisomerase 2 family)
MRRLARLAAVTASLVSLGGVGALARPVVASAQPQHPDNHAGAVFVQTNDVSGNQIVAYSRHRDGQLQFAGRYDTGGLGAALGGAAVDKLASQGSLAFDPQQNLLVAVNAGSNTISTFSVTGDRLGHRQILPAGGTLPVSVAVDDNGIYVLDAGDTGALSGYRVAGGAVHGIPGSVRSLHLIPATPQFLNTPGQVIFTPSGRQLIVTTKENTSSIDVFRVAADGSLSATPTVNAESNLTPFGVTFDPAGQLVVAEVGPDALATYTVNANGTLSALDTLTDGQAALCWVVSAGGRFFYAGNAGSASVSGYTIDSTGALTLVDPATATDPGTIDSAATPDGAHLYVETGADGIVNGFAIAADGSLTFTGSVAPLLPGHTGIEGIAAT